MAIANVYMTAVIYILNIAPFLSNSFFSKCPFSILCSTTCVTTLILLLVSALLNKKRFSFSCILNEFETYQKYLSNI